MSVSFNPAIWRILPENYLIGGSYVVNKELANDIDIFVHEYEDKKEYGGFHRLIRGDKKYDEIDFVRLIAVYEGTNEGTKYNIIVVGAAFWPAYLGAVAEMIANPEQYSTREERVGLHRMLSRQVAEIAHIALPDTAY